MNDPQSLHKYLYVHGDPIGRSDPAGKMSLATTLGALSLGAKIAIGTLTVIGVGYLYGTLNNLYRRRRGYTKIVNIYVPPFSPELMTDADFLEHQSSFETYRVDVLAKKTAVMIKLSMVNGGFTKYNIIDGVFPAETRRGYDRASKTINIEVEWSTAKNGIAQGANGRISLRPIAFAESLDSATFLGSATATVDANAKQNYLANVMMHETAHLILDRSQYRQIFGLAGCRRSSSRARGGLSTLA